MPTYLPYTPQILALLDSLKAEIQQDLHLNSDQQTILVRDIDAAKAQVPARLEIQQD
jgi:hypothetical protein